VFDEEHNIVIVNSTDNIIVTMDVGFTPCDVRAASQYTLFVLM